MVILLPQMCILLVRKLCCTSVSSDQNDHKGKKHYNHTCFQTPQSCSWLFDRINLDPKTQIKYSDTKNQLADILTKTNFTRDEWNHLFVFVQHWPFQFHQWSWSDVEKNARRCKWRKSNSKIKDDDEFGLTIQREGSERACLDCIGKRGENQIWKSESTSELVECAANKYGGTCDGR